MSVKDIWEQIQDWENEMSRSRSEKLINQKNEIDLSEKRDQLLQKIRTHRNTEIIPLQFAEVTQSRARILKSPEFAEFIRKFVLPKTERETAGKMSIDFLAPKTKSDRPIIHLASGSFEAEGGVGSVVLEGDEGKFSLPGEIEWHTHTAKTPHFTLQTDYGDLRNAIEGPAFMDPEETLPTNTLRWIWATFSFIDIPHSHEPRLAMVLYLYDLSKYDGTDPISGLRVLTDPVWLNA